MSHLEIFKVEIKSNPNSTSGYGRRRITSRELVIHFTSDIFFEEDTLFKVTLPNEDATKDKDYYFKLTYSTFDGKDYYFEASETGYHNFKFLNSENDIQLLYKKPVTIITDTKTIERIYDESCWT